MKQNKTMNKNKGKNERKKAKQITKTALRALNELYMKKEREKRSKEKLTGRKSR